MSSRQLLGGAAILLFIATAVWYVVGAPSRGSGVEPNASARVAISATATGSGSWVRYLITVKNLADGDFAGDVQLLDRDDSEGSNTPAGPSPNTVMQPPQLPSVPAVAARSAYEIPLSVASRKSRTITVLAPDFFNFVQAVAGSSVLDGAAVDRPPVMPVAVLSDVESAAGAILGLRYDQFAPRVAGFSSARGFPSSPLLLAGYMTVVIDQFDTATLSDVQVQALRDFVGFGGTLVLAAGSSWRRTIAPLPTDLLPVRFTTSGSLSLAPVASLAGISAGDVVAPVAIGTLAAGARSVLGGDGGVPLVAELAYGSGKVVQLAYDPSADAAAGTPYAALGWSQAVGRSFEQVPGAQPAAATLLGPEPGFTALLPLSGNAPLPAIWLVGAVLLLYVLVAGPLNYLLLVRRLQRPALFWASAPLVAVLFTGVFYLVGSGLQGSLQDHEVQVIKVGPGQSVSTLEYHRILFLRRGDHLVTPQPDSLVAPLTLETFRTTGSTCERCTSQLGGPPTGAEHVVPAQAPVVDEQGVVYGSVRVVASSSTGHLPVGLDAQLAVRGGRVQGVVTNRGQQPVAGVSLFSQDSQVLHQADLAAFVPPGGRATVDAPLAAAIPAGASADAALLRAVATQALLQHGPTVLVALTAPTPSRLLVDGQQPPGAGIAVLQQSVTLAGADSSLRDFQRRRLASTSGDQRSGFSDVYDIALPGTSGPLALGTTAQWTTPMEVYNWAKGAFEPVPTPGDPSVSKLPLSPEQVQDGVVRVRVHEPRISWGSSVWVDTP